MPDKHNIPTHIAIIMDGNGRWAKKRGLPRIMGHRKGADAVRQTVRACGELGVKYLTLYAFSTENWKRPREEVGGLMKLLGAMLKKETSELMKNNVRLNMIGDIDGLPEAVKSGLKRSIAETAGNSGLTLTLALNYGSRAEITGAAKEVARKASSGALDPDSLTEEGFSRFLDTKDMPDPDLLIRTSGEMRVSNFLLWQVSYAEFYVTKTLWPDFGKKELQKAISEYQRRQRRFGG